MLVAHQKMEPFISLSASSLLDYRRTAAVSFASFTLHETNKPLLVQTGAVVAMLALAVEDDLAIKRDATFSLANLSDTPELQTGHTLRKPFFFSNNLFWFWKTLLGKEF